MGTPRSSIKKHDTGNKSIFLYHFRLYIIHGSVTSSANVTAGLRFLSGGWIVGFIQSHKLAKIQDKFLSLYQNFAHFTRWVINLTSGSVRESS